MFKRKTRGVFEQKKKTSSRNNSRTKIFGNPIDPTLPVPLVIEQCIGYIRQNGLNMPNIFRDLQYEKIVEQTRDQIDKGKPLWLSHLKTKGEDVPVKVAAGLIKVFLLELAEPLSTFALYDSFIKVSRDHAENPLAQLKSIKELIRSLPRGNYILFWNILSLLSEISQHADQNKMDPSSLAIDLGISFFHCPREDNSLEKTMSDSKNIHEIVTFMIEEFDFIFNEAQPTKTLARLNSTEASSNRPSSVGLDFLSSTIFKQPVFDWSSGKEFNLTELLNQIGELSPTENDLPGELDPARAFLLKSMDLHDKPIVNPVLDLALGNIEIEPPKHGPFYMKLTFDSLHTEEDETETTDSRVQLNNVEDDPYVSTEPILVMIRDVDSDEEDIEDVEYDDLSEEPDAGDDNSGLNVEDAAEIDYFDSYENETFTPTRKSPLLDLDLQIDPAEDIRSPARLASLSAITNHLEHIVTPRVTSTTTANKSRKTDLQTRVRRASVHLKKKSSGSNPLSPLLPTTVNATPLPSSGGTATEAIHVLQWLHEFIDIMIDDITNLEVGQVRFIKDLFNVIDKHLVIPSVDREPRPILPHISQALIVRMEKLATQEEETTEENEEEKEEQKKQSLLEATDISCRIRQTISTTTQHWDEFDPQQIEKLVECVQSVEECVVNILAQEEALEARKRDKSNDNVSNIDPRLLKLKGLLDSHVEDLREEFSRIREEVVQTYEKHRVQHVTLLLKFCKEINKQMLHQEPAMSLSDEELAELSNFPIDANPDLIGDKLAKANQIIIHCIDQWDEELNLFKEETALGVGSKPLSAITHSIISYSQTITNLRSHVTPFCEHFQKALKQAKFRESFDEISRLMQLNFALLSRIKNLMENDKSKFTRGDECIYAARIAKVVQEILSDMTKSDWSVPEYKLEQFVTQEAQDPKKIEILKTATIKLLDTIHENLGQFKIHLTKWVNNADIYSLGLFSKNLKIVSALFTQVYYDCCDNNPQESPQGLSPRKSMSEKREKLQTTAIALLDQVIQRLEELKSHATAEEPPENLYYLAIISKNITAVISDLNNKEQLQRILDNPPQKPTARGLKGLSPQKTQQLTVGLVKSFTDTAVRLQSLKQSLQQPNVTEGELLACFHLAHSVLSVMKCIDIK